MNQVAETNQPSLQNPFIRKDLPEHANVGTVAIESERAIAEAQGKLVIAKRFPRSEAISFQKAIDACCRPSLAAVATYKYDRGGKKVSGPSIRLAEELARCWGNIDYGTRELSRKDGVSEMEAYCWDMETNTISSQKFTVRHIRDKADGGQALTSERDVYEITANMAARRVRARILAILPPDLVDAALDRIKKTNAGDTTIPLSDRIKRVVLSFGNAGITVDMIQTYLGHEVDKITPDELADLTEIRNSIRDGEATIGDFFKSAQAALATPTQSPEDKPENKTKAKPKTEKAPNPPAHAQTPTNEPEVKEPPKAQAATPEQSPPPMVKPETPKPATSGGSIGDVF